MRSVDFGTGTTTDDFAALVNDPVLIDKLNSLVTTGIIAAAVALSIRAEMPSGPLAFVTSREVGETGHLPQYRGVVQDRSLGLLQSIGCPWGIVEVESC